SIDSIVLTVAALLRENHLALRQENLSNIQSLIEKAAGIIPEIEHQPIHATLMQLLDPLLKQFCCIVIESARHIDVADVRLNHVTIRHRGLRVTVAHDIDCLDVAGRGARYGHLDQTPARSANL